MLRYPGTALACSSWLSLTSIPTTSWKCGANNLESWPVPHPRSTARTCGCPFWGFGQQYKNCVWLVASALPHVGKLKPNSKLPMIEQYKLPQKAIAGMEGVFQSLLHQSVWLEASSPCSTHILGLFGICKLLIAFLCLQLQLCLTQILFWLCCPQTQSITHFCIFSIPLHPSVSVCVHL